MIATAIAPGPGSRSVSRPVDRGLEVPDLGCVLGLAIAGSHCKLILLFLFPFGFLASVIPIDDRRRADKAGAVLAIVGVINVPIIYFSVKWWNTPAPGASVSVKGSSMATTMLGNAGHGAGLLDVLYRRACAGPAPSSLNGRDERIGLAKLLHKEKLK